MIGGCQHASNERVRWPFSSWEAVSAEQKSLDGEISQVAEGLELLLSDSRIEDIEREIQSISDDVAVSKVEGRIAFDIYPGAEGVEFFVPYYCTKDADRFEDLNFQRSIIDPTMEYVRPIRNNDQDFDRNSEVDVHALLKCGQLSIELYYLDWISAKNHRISRVRIGVTQ